MQGRTELMLRNSERKAYKRCRWLWWQAYVRKLEPKRTALPLTFGDLVHQALARWYVPGTKRGAHPAETFVRLYDAIDKRGSFTVDAGGLEAWNQARPMGVDMLTHYVQVYGQDEHIRILSPEQAFQVRLRHRGRYRVTAVGTGDALIQLLTTGRIAMLEHKTAASISTAHLGLDEQAGTYLAVGELWLRDRGILAPDEELDYVLYNFLRKTVRDERPQNDTGQHLNKDGTVSKRQPPPYFERVPIYRGDADKANLLWRIKAEAYEMQMVRAGELPLYKTPTHECGWCPMFDACELHESGADWQALLDLTMNHWEPYAAHADRASLIAEELLT